MPTTLLVNLFAGPGAGKSTTMAGVFSFLKLKGVRCEMASEYAKEKVWENSLDVLKNQIYVFGKQLHMIDRLVGKVDVVITDSPLLLSLIYATREGDIFKALVLDVHSRYKNFNVLISRAKDYDPVGRLQTEDQARAIDTRVQSLLDDNGIEYSEYLADESLPSVLGRDIIARL